MKLASVAKGMKPEANYVAAAKNKGRNALVVTVARKTDITRMTLVSLCSKTKISAQIGTRNRMV